MSLATRARAPYQYRSVLWLLVVRDLKVRYAGSVLGYVWTVLDPLMMTGVYWFVFSVIFTSRRVGESPYILFLVVGLLSWQWFSASVTETSRALTAEARLVRSTRLPREIWVFKVVGSKGLEFVFSLPIVALFMVVYLKPLSWHIILLPLAIVLQTVLLCGLGLALAAATVLVRDLQRVVRIGLRVMFYLSPVIYSVSNLHLGHHLTKVFWLNPMTGILELYRSVAFAEQHVVWPAVGVSAVVSLLLLAVGAAIFRKLENAVLKEI